MSTPNFTDAVAKGMRLSNLLDARTGLADTLHEENDKENDEVEPEQSPFMHPTDLEKHGYIAQIPPEPFTLHPLKACLEGLGVSPTLSADGGPNHQMYHVHIKAVTLDGVEYTVSFPL